MQGQLRIAFRGMTPPIGVEDNIRERVATLETLFNRITACSVVIEASHRSQHQGKLYQVRISMMVPDRELLVSRDSGANHAHEDLRVAIRDAFDAARRQLQDYARQVRGDVKQHTLVGQPSST